MSLHSQIKYIELGNDVPQNTTELKRLRNLVKDFVSNKSLIPPLLQEDVLFYSAEFILQHPEYSQYQKLIAVIINNYAWEPIVRSIPFNKRILLLPQCLKQSTLCTAEIDHLGLLCKACGSCKIDHFTKKAEQKGYHTIVSEGTGAVSLLLASGQIECIIGVGCLDSLERSFPLAISQAIPSIALPLFSSDCKDSTLDEEWLLELISMNGEAQWKGWINLDNTRKTIETWFAAENLKKLFRCNEETAQISNSWLESGGKRWRPLIMVSIYKAFVGKDFNEETAMKLAIAVECFHKASLVHDDIADDDKERYGQVTLHEKYDTPIALNIGDLLMGYGYQMIAESGVKPDQIAQLLTIASKGHVDLCIGQGQELIGRKKFEILPVNKIIKIFKNKTSPAFEVALKFGAVISGADQNFLEILGRYSEAMGIAYQIKDDLEDFNQEKSTNDINAFRPSVVLALMGEKYPDKMNEFIKRYNEKDSTAAYDLYQWAEKIEITTQIEQMLLAYKQKAFDVLSEIKIAEVKVLLFRLLNKIINISEKK